jgi:hypothetical protein
MATFTYWRTMNKQIIKQRLMALALATAAVTMAMPLAASAQSQPQAGDGVDRLTVHLSDPSQPGTVKASLINGGITVKAYDGKDVIIEARTREWSPGPPHPSAPPPGMHRLTVGTTGLTADEENNDVEISTESIWRTVDLTLTVPVHTSLSLRTVNNGGITVTGIDGDIELTSVNGGATLNNVAGSVVTHTINGTLNATFARLNPSKPIALSSMNGDIDITLPADAKATFNLHSDRGGVYSDFDVQFQSTARHEWSTESGGGEETGKYHVRIGGAVHGTINGGGTDVQLSNFNGNIYIHKAGAH